MPCDPMNQTPLILADTTTTPLPSMTDALRAHYDALVRENADLRSQLRDRAKSQLRNRVVKETDAEILATLYADSLWSLANAVRSAINRDGTFNVASSAHSLEDLRALADACFDDGRDDA